jgi:hypothetical protein
MRQSNPARVRKIAGTGLLALALIAASATWPWNRAELPAATAQEETTTTDGVAATEYAAAAEAAASGENVEALNLRTETRDVVANPDGTFTATEHATAVRTVVDGEWIDIDPTLEVAADGTIAPKATTMDVRFAADGDEPLVTVSKNGHTIAMDWAGDLPEPTIEGDTAVYANVLPEVDLRVTALEDGFTHTLVVNTPEAAASPELESIEWPVTLDGISLETTPEGGLSIVDESTLDAWMSSGTAAMWDSSGLMAAEAIAPDSANIDDSDPAAAQELSEIYGETASLGVTETDSAIILTPDQDLLTSDDTVFPVYIDPVYRDETRKDWAMVSSDYPDTAYWRWTGDEGVGTWNGGDTVKRVFFSVPTAAYSGKDIIKAEFGVTVHDNWWWDDHDTGNTIYLDKVSGFSSNTTWDNKPSGQNVSSAKAPAAGANCAAPNDGASTAMEFNITSTVATAANAGASKLSFQVRNASESNSQQWIRVCNNAQLRVQYNTPPSQPLMSNMRTSPGGVCQWGLDAGTSYVNELPVLYVKAFDPDGALANEWGPQQGGVEQIRVKWYLTTANNTMLYSSHLSAPQASGREFALDMDTAINMPDIPDGTEVRWEAVVTDDGGLTYSPSSAAGDGTRCRLIYDTSAPPAPAITSTDFPTGDVVSPMVGETGTFTVSTTDSTVVAYLYKFTDDSTGETRIDLSTPGASAIIEHLPMSPGDNTLEVTALDSAGNRDTAAKASYSFIVNASTAAGKWLTLDSDGNTTAPGADDDTHSVPGPGVTLGADGPGTVLAADFDGTSDAYIATDEWGIAPTGEGVAITARANVTDLSRDGVVASIDGGLGEAGMTLSYRSTSPTTGTWVLSMPDMATGAFSAWEVTAGTVTAATGWVHLTGVWNDITGQMTLYLNGDTANAVSAPRSTVWWGDGTVQIGRAMTGGFWDDHFTGQIADVSVYDRIVPGSEAAYLGWEDAVRQGLWQFNTAESGNSADLDGGAPAALSGDASINPGPEFIEGIPIGPEPLVLVGAGDLLLDGTGDYAAVASVSIDTSRSFSMSARARLDVAATSTERTVLAIAGANTAAIEVVYDPACGTDGYSCWALRLRSGDSVSATTVAIEHTAEPMTAATGQELTVTFDALTREVSLYVNGSDPKSVTLPVSSVWTAEGSLQIGRGFTNGTYEDYYVGSIDEVRLYTGVLSQDDVDSLSLLPNTDRPNL